MRKQRVMVSALLFAAALGMTVDAAAKLFSRAGGTMVYDSDLNVTWLADANYAVTQYAETCGAVGSADGRMEWIKAQELVSKLVYAGVSGWRLPKTAQPDATCSGQNPPEFGAGSFGFNCKGGELGHLFYGDVDHGLGGTAGVSIKDTHNQNFALFKNVESAIYWYTEEFAPFPVIAWNFHFEDGLQNFNSKSVLLRVWPVRDGDVGDVPAPPSAAQKNKPNCNRPTK